MRNCRICVSGLDSARQLTLVMLGWVLVALSLVNPVLAGEGADNQGSPNVLRIAYVDMPPFTFQNALGEADGTFVDTTRKVALEAGYLPQFILLPISRVYLYLSNGEIDVWPGLTGIPAIEGETLESWVSPALIQLSAWYREGTPPLDDFGQLKGKTLIVIGGYTYGGLIDWLHDTGDIRITEAPNHRSAVDMLKRKRGDYLLDYRLPVQEILTQPSDEVIRQSEVRTRNAAWIFSLANPRAALLREAFDDAYLRLEETGAVPSVTPLAPAFIVPGLPAQYR